MASIKNMSSVRVIKSTKAAVHVELDEQAVKTVVQTPPSERIDGPRVIEIDWFAAEWKAPRLADAQWIELHARHAQERFDFSPKSLTLVREYSTEGDGRWYDVADALSSIESLLAGTDRSIITAFVCTDSSREKLLDVDVVSVNGVSVVTPTVQHIMTIGEDELFQRHWPRFKVMKRRGDGSLEFERWLWVRTFVPIMARTDKHVFMSCMYVPPTPTEGVLLGPDKNLLFHFEGAWFGEFPITNEVWGTAPENESARGNEQVPVVNVNFNECEARAKENFARMVEDYHWEYAGRGLDGREYPWGNEQPTDDKLIWSGGSVQRTKPEPVGTVPNGASPFGLQDMAGNVWEWTDKSPDPSATE